MDVQFEPSEARRKEDCEALKPEKAASDGAETPPNA
jgi:hypothetical protein